MTEQTLLPSPDQPPEPVAAAPIPSRRDLLPWLYGLGFLLLATAIFYVWQYPVVPGRSSRDVSGLTAVERHLADIDVRLVQLEQRPAADISKITAHVAALDGLIADQARIAGRMDMLSGRIEALSGRDQAGVDAFKQQIDALTSRVATVEAATADLDGVTKRLKRIARLQEASFALASGRPIGDLPNAPEALKRFAHTPPPTEAQLRLRFPAAAQAALAAKQTSEGTAPLVDRVWARAQGLITIRHGDTVVVGNSSAIIVNSAQAALDAGDLAGAITALDALKGPPEQAMVSWVADAKALLSARSTLADMSDQP